MSDRATMRMEMFKRHAEECKSGKIARRNNREFAPLKWEDFKRIHCREMANGMTEAMIVDLTTRLAWSADQRSIDEAVCDMFDSDLNVTVQQVANRFGMTTNHVKTILMNR